MKITKVVATTLAALLLAFTSTIASAETLTATRCGKASGTTQVHNITNTRTCSGEWYSQEVDMSGGNNVSSCSNCGATTSGCSGIMYICRTCHAMATPTLTHSCPSFICSDGNKNLVKHQTNYCSVCHSWVSDPLGTHYLCSNCGHGYSSRAIDHYYSEPYGYFGYSSTFTAYKLDITAPENITISVEEATAFDYVIAGRTVTLDLSNLRGLAYSLTVNGNTTSDCTGSVYQFEMPSEDVVMDIQYEKEPQQVVVNTAFNTYYNAAKFNLGAQVSPSV